MDKFFEKSILFDLYGGLLSDKEKTAYEYKIIDDLSFQEIGEELSMSRQGAYDLYKHADKKLHEIDKKLDLMKTFLEIEKDTKDIKKLAINNKKIINLSDKILKNLKKGGND